MCAVFDALFLKSTLSPAAPHQEGCLIKSSSMRRIQYALNPVLPLAHRRSLGGTKNQYPQRSNVLVESRCIQQTQNQNHTVSCCSSLVLTVRTGHLYIMNQITLVVRINMTINEMSHTTPRLRIGSILVTWNV